ncbi:hypothetical protein [Nocardioides sp. HB32]
MSSDPYERALIVTTAAITPLVVAWIVWIFFIADPLPVYTDPKEGPVRVHGVVKECDGTTLLYQGTREMPYRTARSASDEPPV